MGSVSAVAVDARRDQSELDVLRMSSLRPAGTVCFDAGGYEVQFDWGEPHELGTAAYWVDQTRTRRPSANHRLGRSLAEETVACILGGYGLPADVGLAAFQRIRVAGLISTSNPPGSGELERLLAQPLDVPGRAKPGRYRFPKQRAARVSAALQFLADYEPPEDGAMLRDWLLAVPGVGPKTASWIARNWIGAEDVAIVDIHIRRAGIAAGFFCSNWRLPHDYDAFETAFCQVARLGRVSSAALDARIWRDLRYLGRAGELLIGSPPQAALL